MWTPREGPGKSGGSGAPFPWLLWLVVRRKEPAAPKLLEAQPLSAPGLTTFTKQMAKEIRAGSRARGFSQRSPVVPRLS